MPHGSRRRASGGSGGGGPPWRRGPPPEWVARRRRRGTLRRRLTFAFTFVALAAVGLTTWLTLGAVFGAQQELFGFSDAGGSGGTAQQSDGRMMWMWGRTRGDEADVAAPSREAFRRISRTAFLAGLLSFGMAALAASAFTRVLTRPLIALTDGAKRFERGERGIRLRVPAARDEFQGLTLAFNTLVAALERQETWRRNMTADIAHDLRTPLAVLRSEIEAMQDTVVVPDAAALGRLHGEVMRLARLVDDLRMLSSAESGGLTLERREVAVAELLTQSVEGFRGRAERLGVALTVDVADHDLRALVDPDRIGQVIANLLDNALHYAPGGPITVAAERAGGEEAETVRVSVRDHGPGIPDGASERVFERFFRGDSSRTRAVGDDGAAQSGGGSGLGLAIAKAIVEDHGGSIEAANAPQGGAIFTFHLPRA
ncbi:MAG: two-component sensor histidine kinase [Trueperaceae bacterium]|nr:two-component sensor histidine kinase [Trueperaceae bacterium]